MLADVLCRHLIGQGLSIGQSHTYCSSVNVHIYFAPGQSRKTFIKETVLRTASFSALD